MMIGKHTALTVPACVMLCMPCIMLRSHDLVIIGRISRSCSCNGISCSGCATISCISTVCTATFCKCSCQGYGVIVGGKRRRAQAHGVDCRFDSMVMAGAGVRYMCLCHISHALTLFVVLCSYGPRQSERKFGFSDRGRLVCEVNYVSLAQTARGKQAQVRCSTQAKSCSVSSSTKLCSRHR
jgi:hypothetical protein